MQLLLFLSVLTHASVVDIKHKNVRTLTHILLLITGLLEVSLLSFLGLILTALPIFIVALMGGIGGGDVKLCAMCGFCLGVTGGIFGTLIGVTCALVIIPIKRWVTKEKKPFKPFALVPFLSIGYAISAIFIM